MTYTKYNDENNHSETCQFEEWDKDKKEMTNCGLPAVGRRGGGKGAVHLCEFHFNYAISIDGEQGNVKKEHS